MKIYYKLSFLVILFVFACDESKLEQVNPNQFAYDQYYINGNQLTAATNAIYAQFYGADLWGRMMQYFSDTRADEHAAGGGQLEVHNAQLLAGTYNPGNYPINAAWRGFYRMIHRANAVIQNGPQIEDITEGLRTQRIAEAKFLRAYAYYYLNVNWGAVPIYTEIVESVNDAQPPADEAVLYELLETDLNAIDEVLPWRYVDANTGQPTSDMGRVNRGAVKLLLARVLMHQGKFADARTVLEEIYEDGPYELTNDYSANFREESEYNIESIFEIGFTGNNFDWSENGNSTNNRGTVMFQDYSPVAWRNMIPSNKLLDEFEHTFHGDAKTDPRLGQTVYFSGDIFGPQDEPIVLTDDMQGGASSVMHGNTIKASWKKYSPMYKLNPGGYYISPINYRNMRYAEVLLKLAECENELSMGTGATGSQAQAIIYLNEIRNRVSVDMPPYPTTNYPCDDYDEVMRAIMHESMVEFSNEKLRVLDLARWRKNGKFSVLNPDPIAYIVSDASKALLPYPNEETSRNPNW